ncbi:NAD(P)H-dependent oxidoreductase subunit E [Vallitalea pronyensis]|uniref:NAD(P)H-dependent oxidoreductase subunit E n=1 Tax=Vallitalea pronyensis TaxID=1348613 RepID=A0A8J8SIX0_9FIRM|nr:NAD(P)H-dependent oxidoreductase subunit E [Vallitalea pronyensis]QUI24958.1 NAD(P)H-dependent oxidoreductase subunit E [Vallitalea pronyensis]
MAVNTALTEEKFQELEQYIDAMPSTKGELIRVLHKAQDIFGYLPQEVQKFVGKQLNLSTAKVFGVVSFYSYFTMVPKGEFDVAVCMGTACYVRGADEVLDELKKELDIEVGETTPDGKFSITSLRCVGACGLAPVVMVGEKVYGRVTKDMVKDILAEYK